MKTSVLGFLVLFLALAGCASQERHREDLNADGCVLEDKDDPTCAKASLVKNKAKRYTMAFIEIDDQGVMHHRTQIENALKLVERGKRNYVVVHVHGWHNSAAYTSHQVRRFHDRLDYAARLYEDMNVVGIYVGWRGDSITVPGINKVTFWERKNTSEEVGRNALPEFLFRLEAAVDNAGDSTLLTVGHSFGASVVYNAIHQLMLQRLASSGDGLVRGYGDLVLLINPAIEAMRFASLRDAAELRHKRSPFLPEQGPVLVVAASEGDWAAGKAFPAGRFFSTFFESHRSFQSPHRRLDTTDKANPVRSEWAMDIMALGHYTPYTTHGVVAVDRVNPSSPRVCPNNQGWLQRAVNRQRAAADSDGTGERWNTHWVGKTRAKLLDNAMGLQMWHTGRSASNDPFWVVSAHRNVIPDHSSINSVNFWCFVEMALREANGFKNLTPAAVPLPELDEQSEEAVNEIAPEEMSYDSGG